jgi:hypothetical protein
MGPVARIINERADRIYRAAGSNIAQKMQERTGDLAGSLKTIPIHDPSGYRVVVGADAQHSHGKSGPFPYARALETGINPLTGEPMHFRHDFSFMVPAVRSSGFRQRA